MVARWYPGLDEDMVITFRDGSVICPAEVQWEDDLTIVRVDGDKPDAVAIKTA